MTGRIRVVVVEEHEVFRRGLVASLLDDGAIVVDAPGNGAAAGPPDVAIVSPTAAGRERFDCPLVVCSTDGAEPRRVAPGNVIAGILPRAALTEVQLHATVRAVAAGLRVNAEDYGAAGDGALEARAVRVAQLLSRGCSTREIATEMGYSERTIKKLIQELELTLKARSRAQIVAHAIRLGVI